MPKKRKTLAHAEVWDDTALVQSWEDALEEYKLYHSIHAKGERVEDVIKSAEREDREINGDANGVSVTGEEGEAVEDRNEGLEDGELEDGELEEEPVNGDVLDGTAREVSIQDKFNSTSERAVPPITNGESEHKPAVSVPAAAMSGVNNEALKNLMMSWYWAGYYTGLHEGQQQAQNSSSERG